MTAEVTKPAAACEHAAAAQQAPQSTPRRTVHHIRSDELFAGANEVHIEHGGALYRLQRTSLGKLILTK